MVLPDDVRSRVLSYLAHQAQKELPAICDPIAEERRRLLDLLESVSEEQATFAPVPNEWSIKQVVSHVASAEKGVASTIGPLAGVLDETKGEAALDPETEPERSLGELRLRLLQARQDLLNVVAQVPDDAGLEAKHDHPFFGPLNWKEWLAFQRVHDRDHIGQIEAAQQSPSYPEGS